METGVVIIQEPEFTKTSAEEAPTMEVDKVNLSSALDDCRNSITQDVAEDLNGSGNKETEELKHEKEEAMKTTSVVEDNKIVKEIANETETDEQGTTFVHEPESFNKNTNDANIILSDVTLEKEKEDDTTQNLEEVQVVFQKPVTEEDQTETKDSQEQEKEISKVLVPVKSSEDDMEKILDSAREEIPIKTDEEKDSRSVENSVNETETEHNATVSVEEISRNGENIVKERALEEEASTDGVSLHDLETTKDAEPRLDTKEKDETEEHEHLSVRDIPQDETLIPKAEIVNTLDTTSDAEPSLDLKEEEETVTSSDEVQERVTTPKTSTDQTFKDTEEDEHVLARNMPQAESLVTNEDTESIIDLKEDKEQNKTEISEEIPSDLALKVDKEELKEDKLKVDQVVGAQTMEEQRDLEVNESEAEPVDRNRTDETEVSQVEKLVAHPDVKSVEQMEKPSLESPSQVSEEKIKNLDEKIEEKTEEGEPPHQESQEEGAYGSETKEEEKLVDHPDVISVEHMEKPSVESPSQVSEEKSRNLDEKIEEKTEQGEPPHQESQEEGSYGTETKEEVVSVTESSELGEPIEQDKEKNLQKDQIHKHEPANEEVKSDEVIKFSSASASEEREGETVVKAKKIEERKANEEEQIQPSIETVETVDTEPVKSNEDDIEESSSSTREEIQIKSKDEEKASTTAETFVNGTEHEHNATNSVEGILKNIVNETALEEDRQGEHEEPVEAIKNSDDAEKISHGMTGDREKEEDITWKTEEVQESSTVIETPTLEEEHIESKASKDTEEHEHVLMPQIDTLVTEAEDANTSTVQEAAILKTLETTSNETEVGQETIKDRELSLDLKEDKEKEETETAKTVIASDEERPPNQVDVQAEESVEVKSKETVQVKSNEEKKHENLLDNEPESVLVAKTESQDKFEDIPSDLVLEVDKEELKDDKTEVNKVDGIQVMGKQRGLELNEPEAEHIDRNKSDEGAETIVVKSDERMQSSSLECPSEVSTPVDEKIEEKLQEEVTLPQEGSYGLEIKEDTLLVPESKDLGEKSQEEVSSLPKETKLQQEHIEKCEPTNEVPNDQKSPVEEKSDEVIQVSSEEREGGIIVKLEDIKANEEEKIQKSLGPLDIAEPQSLLSSYSEEQEHETVSEKIEDERVKEEEPIVQILSEGDATESHERQDEIHKTGETAAVQEEKTRDIGSSLNEKCSVDQTKTEEQANEHVDSQTWLVFSEKSDGETLTAETVRDMPPQGETIVTVAEAVDTSTVQEVAVLNTLETNINEPEAVHRPIVGEEESQVTKEDTEPRMELKADKEQEERETVPTVIFSNEVITDESQGREESVEVKPKEKDENLLDVPYEESAEKMQSTSLESPCEQSEETSKTVDEKIEEIPQAEVTLHKEIQETKEETVQANEEESCPPNEQEKETTLQKEQIEKHESTSEEDTTAHQIPVEEKSDEVSSASPSGETVVEAEKIEDIKENEEEQVEDKIQRSLEAVETVEPHSSFPSPPEEHETVAEAEKIEDGKVKETEPMEDMSEKDLEISETKDMSPPFEASGLDGTESSELVGGFEEQKPKQVKEILEGDETKFHSSETIPQEPVSDVVAVQLKIEDNAAVGHERREELSNDVEMEETTVAQEEQTRDIGFSMDQTQPEEQVNESIGEQEKVSSTEKEETKTKEFEEENLDKHVDSSENNDDETLVAETKKEDEVITVSLDGSITSKTSENECIKQEEFENIKAPNPEESKDDKSQEVSETIDAKGDHTLAIEANQTPSFVSELEDKIPKQIEDIHEEETKEARVLVDQSLPVEETEDIQIPSLVSEQEDQASKEIQEIHEEEEDTNAHQIPVEEKSDEVIQVSSASASGETVVEAEKFEDIKENEEEQLEDKIQRSLEAVETVEPHSSFPSPPEEHDTVADAEKIEDGKVKETDPMGDMSEKDLEISETKDMSPPFEASGLDGTESYELVAAFEEQKTKQVKEILEGDETRTEKVPSSETIPQETLFESLEAPKQVESKEDKSQEVSETIEAKGDHTLDIEANQTPSFSSELKEKFPKQIEDIREEETKEARVLVDQSLPIEVSQEKQIPSLVSEQEEHNSKQVQEIHEEETNVSHKVEATSGRNLPVEASQAHQTPSSELVSGLDDKTSKEVEEIHDEETKGHKLQEEEIIPTEIVQRESFSESPASMLASGEDDQGTVQERNFAGETQEEKHGSEEKEESLGETKPKESEVERKEKSGDQIETSTKVTKVEDEDTKERDTEVAEITEGQSLSHAPENVCLEQEELKDIGTLKPGAITEDQDSLKNDDFTFSTETGEAEHGDETSSTLPVVGILKELQTTLERERAINDSEVGSSGNDFHSIKEEPQPLEKNLVPDISGPVTYEKQDEKVVEESPSSEIIEANMLLQDESGETEKIQEERGLAGKYHPIEEIKLQEEHKEEGKVQDNKNREFEVDVEERLQEEAREIAECKEETPASLSLTELVPTENILTPSSDFPLEEPKKEDGKAQEVVNASALEKISLQEDHSRDFETSKKEQNIEAHETAKEEDQIVDIKEEKKNEELQVEKLSGLSARRDTEETFSSQVKKDQEDASELEVEHGSPTLQVKKEEESHSVLGNDQKINEVVTSEKKITDPIDVIKNSEEAEHASNDEHIETQEISDDSKSYNDRDFPTEEAPEDVNADESLTKEALEVQDQPKDFEAPVTYEDTTEQENELTYVQEDIGTNVKPEVRDGHDSVAAQNEESGLIKEKNEVDYLKTEPEDAIKPGVSIEEKNDMLEKTGQEATKEIYQDGSKQTDTVTAIKEEEKETTEECFNSMKNTDDVTEQTKPEIRETDKLSSVSDTQDKSTKQEDEVLNQEKREIADEVPKLENVKISEELQKKDGESESNKESEPTVARKSLSDLIQKGKGTDKTEVATTEPRIEEEPKTEEEDEDGDEHKDDKTSPDSIVMVETKDTVSIIKTQKKSQGILSGVGSKVKHSISKVKKAFTGKSSHTTKPSSPQ